MPVANLQTYRTVALRVRGTTYYTQNMAPYLEAAVTNQLRRGCGFEQIGRVSATPADVVLDLNITFAGRGGTSHWVQNANLATIDTLLVLTDGQSRELLGTARIHGESSGMMIAGASQPEGEAIDIIAKSVADLLAKSGCTGPRVARTEPPPTPPNPQIDTGSGSAPPPDTGSATPPPASDHRGEAEALNEQGKSKLQAADLAGAVAAFQQANALAPDPRYVFNMCLALEAQEQWDNAIGACRQARGMNPDAKLAERIDHRLDLLQHHKK